MGLDEEQGEARATPAAVFAALGDETRLLLLARLAGGERCSIAELTETAARTGAGLTRQSVRKHLRVLERARLVAGGRAGRERLYELDPHPIEEMKVFLEMVSGHWDRALGRLQGLMEE